MLLPSPYTSRRERPEVPSHSGKNSYMSAVVLWGGGSPTDILRQHHAASVSGPQATPLPGLRHSLGTEPVAAGGPVMLGPIPLSVDCKPPPTGYQTCGRGSRAS